MRRAAVLAILCTSAVAAAASAPAPPDGYERSADRGEWVFRPADERDAAIEIRMLAPVDAPRGGIVFVKEWMAAHPGGAAQEPTQPDPRVTAAIRQVSAGKRNLQQALIAIQLPTGQQQLLVVNLPLDRNDLVKRHLDAAGQLGKALLADGPAEMPAAAAPAGPPRDARRLAGAIATVGFYTKTGFGVGGSLTFNPTPIVLFKSGDALRRIASLKDGDSVEALKAASPNEWTRWRKNGEIIEIEKEGAWKKLDFQKTLGPLPRGFKLDGRYTRLSGAGNVAMGGTSSVTVWSELSFARDGGFTSGGGASATGQSGEITTTVAGESPTRRASYDIDGYVLTLRHADGRVEQRLLVTDPKDLDVVWIDGDGYTSK